MRLDLSPDWSWALWCEVVLVDPGGEWFGEESGQLLGGSMIEEQKTPAGATKPAKVKRLGANARRRGTNAAIIRLLGRSCRGGSATMLNRDPVGYRRTRRAR